MLIPLNKKIIAKAVVVEEKTSSGIIMPGTTKKSFELADVVSVAKDCDVVCPRDRVMYDKYSVAYAKHDGEEFLIIPYEAVVCIVK